MRQDDRDADARPILTLGHSPDPDDAFMWWPITGIDGGTPAIDTGRFRFRAVIDDIESLNERAEHGELAITAMSCAQYAKVRERYAITACGASMGDGYGPKLVAKRPMATSDLCSPKATVAIPGERTSAFAALRVLLGGGEFRWKALPFKEILSRVAGGEFDAGVLIHEAQLAYEAAGVHLVADLGVWWRERFGHPLPLGINAVRRDLETEFGTGTLSEIAGSLQRSVEHALGHREAGLRYARRFAQGVSQGDVDAFVGMYVNRWTLRFGDEGVAAVACFLDAVHRCGAGPRAGRIDVIEAVHLAESGTSARVSRGG